MRDTSNSLLTAWVGPPFPDGSYARVAWEPTGSGLGALDQDEQKVISNLPPAGRRHVRRALEDPRKRGHVRKLLASSNPSAALAKQAESDIAEKVAPSGKPIVFNDIADKVGGLVKRAQDAILRAMPNRNTEESRDLINLLVAAKEMGESQRTVAQEYVMGLAVDSLEAELSGWDQQDLALYGLGDLGRFGFKSIGKAFKSIGKTVKKVVTSPVFKKIAIGVGVAAAAIVTGGVILPFIGTTVLPAIVGGVGALGGVIGPAVGSIFGGGGAAPSPEIPGSDGATGGTTLTMEQFLAKSNNEQKAVLSAMGLGYKIPPNWDSMTNAQRTAWMEQNAGVPHQETTPTIDLNKVAEVMSKVFFATPTPPMTAKPDDWALYQKKMEEEMYRQLMAQGMSDAQARQYARQYAVQYGQQAQAQGAQAPQYQAPSYQAPQYGAPGYQGPAPAQASIFGGIPTEYLLLGAAGIYFLAQPSGGGRSYRRNGRRRRRIA